MERIKERFLEKLQDAVVEVREFLEQHGDDVIGEIKVSQLYQGMRGMQALIYETSKLDPEEGIRFRGYSIPELQEKLPKYPGGNQPLPEGIFYLMLMNELPTEDDVRRLSNNWVRRSNVPVHVFKVIDALPQHAHPMTQFVAGIMALRTESEFQKAYRAGINKKDYWDPMFEDSMNLIARLPRLAAYIYRRMYHNGDHIEPDPKLDWAGNMAHMLGFDNEEFRELMRLYMTIHADHEGGNVSAHTIHLVGSALSDAYLSFAAGMNGLAGPLHGLANQEVIRWTLAMRDELGGGLPSKEQIANYVKKTLNEGKVIPGFGHAVLRKTDPRYIAQREFALEHMPDDEMFLIISRIYEVVPEILQSTGKVKNPWPNVDAHSGQLLMHYGLNEYDFYTVLFGVSRALGTMCGLIWDRAMGFPIERPGSTTTALLKAQLSK
ncbi:MAG: citrate (Si)-synthase, eukaryotic [Bacteroidota bacterium]|nr:citrate (Si)-synthase, eukaryotic [Bacteroidota bacterium]MDX5428888.1 citrate (Si)-synthase, eukaryotic [Bacteroidota bacterium]MDX5447109.1 citrate (Si)-synthase, eukaryotic [Bacteroidota bacterium]MDX5506569.1 citrate (Si)-synthase, eukaryotic [Bacteroidota bacterium]